MEQLLTCLICGAETTDAQVVHTRRDDRLVRCKSCRTLFANPQYTSDELAPLYTKEYYDPHRNLETDFRERDYAGHRQLNQVVLGDLQRRYPAILRHKERPVRVLDYGCGVGFFLADCQKRGFVPLGLEFSSVAATYAQTRFGLDVRIQPDETLRQLPDASFELVTAWQVIEHVRRPLELVRELTRVLVPGGILCLALPHLGSLGYRLKRGRWFNVQNLTHLTFIPRDTLTKVLRNHGLVRIQRPILWGGRADFGLARSSLQYLARATALGSELRLYAEKASRS